MSKLNDELSTSHSRYQVIAMLDQLMAAYQSIALEHLSKDEFGKIIANVSSTVVEAVPGDTNIAAANFVLLALVRDSLEDDMV